jgi:hypothetical protein
MGTKKNIRLDPYKYFEGGTDESVPTDDEIRADFEAQARISAVIEGKDPKSYVEDMAKRADKVIALRNQQQRSNENG